MNVYDVNDEKIGTVQEEVYDTLSANCWPVPRREPGQAHIAP